MGTLKSGWLEKLGGFFTKDWKRRYFVLYNDGQLCYYKDAIDREPHGKINLKFECRRVNVGYQVGDGVKVPSHRNVDCLFSISTTEKSWYLLADSDQECRGWAAVIEQARTPITYGGGYTPGPPMPQPGFAPHVMSSGPPAMASAPPMPSAPPPMTGAPPMTSPYPPATYPQASYPQAAGYSQAGYPQPPPPQPYPPQHYAQGYPTQSYPQQGYPPPPPGSYPAPQPGYQTTYAQQPYGQPPVQYVRSSHSPHSSSKKDMLMGAAGGALLGYGMGSMFGGHHHGFGHFGGSFSDDDWGGGWSS